MLSLLFATTLSLSQALPVVEAFCTNAEIEIARPLTEAAISRHIVDAQHERVQGLIQGRYRFTYYKGKVVAFADLNENIHVRFSRLDPADMMRWSKEPCSMTEAEALQKASRAFQKLGYEESEFDLPEAKRSQWIPSPANPNNFVLIPIFGVRWYRKGYPRDQLLPQLVEFIISGTTKKLVYFSDGTRSEGFLRQGVTTAPSTSRKQPAIEFKDAIQVCEPRLKAIGAQIDGPLDQHAKLGTPDEWMDQMFGTSARPAICVDNRYIFEISFGKLRKFYDFLERPIDVLEVRNPQRLQQMTTESCSLDEAQALTIGSRVFQGLGFRQGDFYPPVAHWHVNRTSPFLGLDAEDSAWLTQTPKTGTSLKLPDSFWITWTGNRLLDGIATKQQTIIMEISGVTSNVIFYSHSP